MEFQLKFIGILLMLLGLIHLRFPKYFKWKVSLKSLDLLNNQIFKVHTFFIGWFVFLFGVLTYICSNELISTSLGHKICLGFGMTWLIRLYFQLFVYSSELWKGKRFETIIHIFFTILWVYMSYIYLAVYFF